MRCRQSCEGSGPVCGEFRCAVVEVLSTEPLPVQWQERFGVGWWIAGSSTVCSIWGFSEDVSSFLRLLQTGYAQNYAS